MASVPDQSGANQVQFDYKAASSLVDDILAVPATASAVMNEVSDGSTAPVPPAQSPAGSTGLSPIPEHDAGQNPLTTPLPTSPDLLPTQVANKETFRTPQHHPEETPRAQPISASSEGTNLPDETSSKKQLFPQKSALELFSQSGGGSAMAVPPPDGSSPLVANRYVQMRPSEHAAAVSAHEKAISETQQRVAGLESGINDIKYRILLKVRKFMLSRLFLHKYLNQYSFILIAFHC